MTKRDHKTQKAEAAKRASKRTIVDREELDALRALRDGAHEELQIRYRKLEERAADLAKVNGDQYERLVKATLEIDHARAALARCDAAGAIAEKRVAGAISERDIARSERDALSAKLEALHYQPFQTSRPQ